MSNNNNKLTNIEDADYRTFLPGSVITRCPSDSARVGLITRGIVSCTYLDKTDVEARTTHLLYEGDWVGLDSLDCHCSDTGSITWKAEDICVIAFLSLEKLLRRGMIELTESVVHSLIRQKKLAMEQSLRGDLPAGLRLERTLMDVAKAIGVVTEEGVFISHLNRTHLADRARVGREYTSRHLRKLREAGKIEMRSKGVLIKDSTLGV